MADTATAAAVRPWQRGGSSGGSVNSGTDGGEGGGGGMTGRLQQVRWRWWSRHQQPHTAPRRCPDGKPSGGDGGGSGGCSRLLLLASLSTSAVAAASRASGTGGGGGGGSGTGVAAAVGPAIGGGGGGSGPRHGFHLPQLSIMRLPGSPSFAEEQDLAQELLDYHTAKHGSHDFMVRRPIEAAPADSAAASGGAGAGTSSGGAAAAAAAVSDGGGVVEWRSRPLRCETCGCWVHLGCAGVDLAEQVPPRPWFHCRACRDTYLRLEAAAERNPHPSSASGTHALYLLTPADHLAAAVSLQGGPGAAAAAAAAASAAGGATVVPFGGGRGPAGAVVPLLLQGFNPDAVQGFGHPAREYDGGKYSAVLLARGQPVAAATFNVFGSDAQLCLLATAVQHRLKGNGSALVADLETTLASLGVTRLLVQARNVALPLWLARLGYDMVPPAEVSELHERLPIAYYDCAVLQKRLTPPLPKAAAAVAAEDRRQQQAAGKQQREVS
ncbi:hypothetical protein PLESTF_000525100 [Pleodorina starrii]|nr:hypothetical protein PLESTM_000188200 [Pleodorina starrii]GLC67172.1 hypothetical protein PLESTF_000525100 [Pleodorina starrii]